MKLFFKIMYVVLLVVISFFIYMFSLANKYYTYLTESFDNIEDNYSREQYIKSIMTAKTYSDAYLKDPLYVAKSEELNNKYELGIYSFMYEAEDESYYAIMFYFKDLGIKQIEDQLDLETYYLDSTVLRIKVDFYFSDSTDPISGYIESYYREQKPFDLANIEVNDQGKTTFQYYQKIDDVDRLVSNELLEKITVSISTRDENGQEVLTNIVDVNHDDNYDNTLMANISNNEATFNGNIVNYDVKDLYEDESLHGEYEYDVLQSYNYIVVRTNVIYYSIVIVLTYLLFFLKPTINFFKNRKRLN